MMTSATLEAFFAELPFHPPLFVTTFYAGFGFRMSRLQKASRSVR